MCENMKTKTKSNWFVVLYCSLFSMLQYGVVRQSGILFVSSMSRFSVDRQRASLPYILCDSVQAFAGPITGFLSLKFGIQQVVTFGCLLSAVGTGACFFAEDIETVTILWGVVFGLGFSFSSMLLPIIITQHFDQNKATAIGITYVGSYIGFAVLPTIVNYLLEKYELSGTFLLLSGILLHCVPLSLLMLRTPKYIKDVIIENKHTLEVPNATSNNEINEFGVNLIITTPGVCATQRYKDMKSSEPSNNETVLTIIRKLSLDSEILSRLSNKFKNSENHDTSEDKSKLNFITSEYILKAEDISNEKKPSLISCIKTQYSKNILDVKTMNENNMKQETDDTSCILKYRETTSIPCDAKRYFSSRSVLDSSKSMPEDAFSTSYDISNNKRRFNSWLPQSELKIGFSDIVAEADTPIGVGTSPPQKYSRTTKAFRTFLEPIFIIVSCSEAVYAYTFIAFVSIIFDFAKDLGLLVTDGAYVIMAFSIASNVGLVSFGWVTDFGYMSLTNLSGIMFLCRTVTLFLMPYSNGLAMLVTIAAVQGLCEASLANLHPLILAEYISEEFHEVAISSILFLSGPVYLATPALIGYFRDGLGSYYYLFVLMSFTSLICAILLFMVPILCKYRCLKDDKIVREKPENQC